MIFLSGLFLCTCTLRTSTPLTATVLPTVAAEPSRRRWSQSPRTSRSFSSRTCMSACVFSVSAWACGLSRVSRTTPARTRVSRSALPKSPPSSASRPKRCSISGTRNARLDSVSVSVSVQFKMVLIIFVCSRKSPMITRSTPSLRSVSLKHGVCRQHSSGWLWSFTRGFFQGRLWNAFLRDNYVVWGVTVIVKIKGSLSQWCFTSTDTVRTIKVRDGVGQDVHLDSHTAPEL